MRAALKAGFSTHMAVYVYGHAMIGVVRRRALDQIEIDVYRQIMVSWVISPPLVADRTRFGI